MKKHHVKVQTGLDTLINNPPDYLKNKRLGLLANPASTADGFIHAKQVVNQLFPGGLAALYAPQHGFFAEKQDNMIESAHFKDPDLDIPVFSLYSETRIPTPEMFDPIDTLVIDIQDVGTRVYTFIYTISYCLEVAASLGKSVVILDRPNPIGGTQVEGNILENECKSFVGRFPIPMRHGMTVAELSWFINESENIGCDLTIIPMKGWQRKMYWQDTGLVWIPPSPNLPTPFSAMVYPGQVIFEGTNVSEARGTTLPFEQFGAPYIDVKALQNSFAPLIKGAVLRPVCFEPTSGKWQNQVCKGFHIHITDPVTYKPYVASLTIMQEIARAHPQAFKLKEPPYEYEYERMPMDLILGSSTLRKEIVAMKAISDLETAWQEELHQFKQICAKFYLYT